MASIFMRIHVANPRPSDRFFMRKNGVEVNEMMMMLRSLVDVGLRSDNTRNEHTRETTRVPQPSIGHDCHEGR